MVGTRSLMLSVISGVGLDNTQAVESTDMFDGYRLWQAERRDDKARKKLRLKYKPEQPEQLAEYFRESDQINEAECLRSNLVVRKAHRLGITIPPNATGYENNENWHFNQATGDIALTRSARSRLKREVRKEEMERLQHRMRWISHVSVPIIGLIGSIMGLISLIHALRK